LVADFGASSPDWVRYATTPHEMFARAFAQYIAEEMALVGRAAGAGMRVSILKESIGSGYQWSKEEFDILKPLVEKILRARGMM
jgi:hypothetical protein